MRRSIADEEQRAPRGGRTGPLPRLPVAGPSVSDLEISYVADAAATGWYDSASAYPRRFEDAFASYVGRRHAVSLPSCTSALHLSLLALGVGPGDEVIVPDATWIGTSAAISYVGAVPVFADVDPTTWCLSAESVADCITPRTRVVIAVDLYGGMPDMAALNSVVHEHGIALVEDAAQAIGSSLWGQPAGAFGTTATFSFHGSKTLTTGEGGMLVTDDPDVHHRVLTLRDHGRAPGDVTFYNQEVGYKYKMSALQAAFGLAQLERIDELVEGKRRIFGWYRERLRDTSGLAINAEPDGLQNSYWMSTIVLDPALGLRKEQLASMLLERGIDSRPFFHPLSSLPAYAALPTAAEARTRNTVSYALCPYGVNLPSALTLTEADVDRVCAALHEVLASAGRH